MCGGAVRCLQSSTTPSMPSGPMKSATYVSLPVSFPNNRHDRSFCFQIPDTISTFACLNSRHCSSFLTPEYQTLDLPSRSEIPDTISPFQCRQMPEKASHRLN
eukprot:2663599-Rhodomonas_salina.3